MRLNYHRKIHAALWWVTLTMRPLSHTTCIIAHYGMAKHPQNRSTECITLSSEKDRDTATGNTYRKFCELWTCRFWVMQADRQTDMLIAILCTPTMGKVISVSFFKHILIDWVKVLYPTRHKTGHFGDVPPSQSLGLVWKKLNLTQQRHTFTNQKKSTTAKNIHKKTKARFSRLLRHPAWKRWVPILIWALHKFVIYLLRHLPTYLQPRDPRGAFKHRYIQMHISMMTNVQLKSL